MLMSVFTMHITYAVEVDGLFYTFQGKYATCDGPATGNTSAVIVVPATISYQGLEYTVTQINSSAFRMYDKRNAYVREVILPNTVERICELAFSNENITSVSLAEGLKFIEAKAFRYTYSLTKLCIPETVQSIGDRAFGASHVTELNIPQSVQSIGDYAFEESHITEIIIPESVSLGVEIFKACNFLRTLIYLGQQPPANWTATSETYVPDISDYNKPTYSINHASVKSMITFSENVFEYKREGLSPTWTNNMEGYSTKFEMPVLHSDAGIYEEIIPVTFTKGEVSFTAKIPYKYTIDPAKLKVKVNNTSRTYGEPNPGFTVSYSGFVKGDDESALTTKPVVATTANERSAVGIYPITISGGEAKNYTLEYEPGELTINKASLNIQVMDATRIYGNDNSTFTIGYSGLKNGETAPEWIEKPTFTTKATKESDAGIYEVTVACEPKNYTIATNTPGKLTIEKATLNVKANNATMDYGGPMPTYSYTYSGFVNGDDESAIATKPSIATEATVKSDAGTYAINPEGAQAKNYDFSYTAGTLTINKRILNVKANSASRMYGEENPTFTIEYDGFVNNETKDVLEVEPIVSTTATVQSKTGTYDIVVSGGRSANYAMTYQNGQLTITPRPLKAFVGNYERPYGEDNPKFELQYEGLAGNDTESSLASLPIARTSATRTSNVGTYEIQVTGGYSPNYTLSYGKGTLTITKAEQNFTWDQDLTSLKVGDQVELQAYTSSKLPISFTTDADDYAEIYKAGTKTYMECKKAGSFHIKAVQEGNDNYYPTQRINKNVTIIDDEDNKPTLNIKQAENGMISTKVSKGGTYTFTILAESGWKIHSVTFNETDVTGDLNSDNTYTTPKITENSTLMIIYEQDGSTVDAVKSSKVNIHATNRGICVNGVEVDDTIQVFTLDGMLQQSVRATESQVEIPLQKDQVYVVKAGGKTVKLRL